MNIWQEKHGRHNKMTLSQSNTAGGWECAACHQWVYPGMSHVCGVQSNPPYYYGQPMFGNIDQSLIERIAIALEKLVVLLEAQ